MIEEMSSRAKFFSSIIFVDDDQKSMDSSEDVLPVDGFFPNNDDDEVNFSFRDNQAAVISMRFRNVNVRKKDEKPKVSKVDRRDSMIRNLDRLTSGQADNVRVYKSTSSYEHVKLSSDSISSILDFAAAIEQFQNMHKISVPAVSLARKSGDTTRCVNVEDNHGFPPVRMDNQQRFVDKTMI